MLILALETSADVCSVAVCDENGVRVERLFRHRMHLSERLMGDVDAALDDAGAALAQVDALAVGLGPGSFTGVRVGVMTVKTWADVLGKPVCGVGALDALAEEYSGVQHLLVPVIRSRPGTFYASVYQPQPTFPRSVDGAEVLSLSELVDRVAGSAAGGRCLLCGPGVVRHGAEIVEALGQAGVPAFCGRPDGPRASLVAAVAARRLAAGEGDDPLALVPFYVAPPPIDPRVEERARARDRERAESSSG